jgi:hypothetical protein
MAQAPWHVLRPCLSSLKRYSVRLRASVRTAPSRVRRTLMAGGGADFARLPPLPARVVRDVCDSALTNATMPARDGAGGLEHRGGVLQPLVRGPRQQPGPSRPTDQACPSSAPPVWPKRQSHVGRRGSPAVDAVPDPSSRTEAKTSVDPV